MRNVKWSVVHVFCQQGGAWLVWRIIVFPNSKRTTVWAEGKSRILRRRSYTSLKFPPTGGGSPTGTGMSSFGKNVTSASAANLHALGECGVDAAREYQCAGE